MRHEKTFKRSDGSRVNIAISFHSDSFSDQAKYRAAVSICEPKKRTFRYVNDTDNYTWRKLTMPEREIAEMQLNLKYASSEEIQQTALELWEKIKPTFI